MGFGPIPGGGCAPATPKTFLRKTNLRVSCPLPLVGTETYTLFGCLSRPWVTFSFGPTETGLGYIVKWLDTRNRTSPALSGSAASRTAATAIYNLLRHSPPISLEVFAISCKERY
jgi:hypothetical protein